MTPSASKVISFVICDSAPSPHPLHYPLWINTLELFQDSFDANLCSVGVGSDKIEIA